MTINEILADLQKTQQQLASAGVDDESKADLDILVLQLRRALQVAIFNPLKDLDSVTVADTTRLRELVGQVQHVIDKEQERVALVRRITTAAKIALKAAGLPIPS